MHRPPTNDTNMNLALNLTRSAAARPDRPALICVETRPIYADLHAAGAGSTEDDQ
jgi:hypothetical protein